MSEDRFRNKCRTCKYLATADSTAFGGYCWQTDDYLKLEEFRGSKLMDTDTGCSDGWEPTYMLAPLFYEDYDMLSSIRKEDE